MYFCLPKDITNKFRQGLKDGSINPEKLSDMTSKERREFLAEWVGESAAKDVNAEFEKKLLLKNQQQGMINWAENVAGLSKQAKRDLVSRIQRMDNVLTAENEMAFLNDLASKKLGVDVTFEEAKRITELSKIVQDLKEQGLETRDKQIEWGNKWLDLHDYVESLKPLDKDIISNVANVPKTLRSTLDFSAPFRQGWGMISRKEFWKAFPEMFKYAVDKQAFRDLQAEIVSHPKYELMKKSGLRISAVADKLSQREEQYISNLLGKIPGVAGSERAYVGFLNKLRMDSFNNLIDLAEMRGENVTPGSKAAKDIANVVNDFTGSGNIGTGDKYAGVVPALNATFFSPRKLSATINMLNPERYVNPKISPTARQAALRNLIGSVGTSAAILTLAAMAGAKIEKDPASSDFGKIVIGNTRYDVTGGNSTYATLLGRLIEGGSKSTTTGKFYKFGEGYKPDTGLDVGGRFLRNKLSPLAAVLVTAIANRGRPLNKWVDAVGQPTSIPKEMASLFVPMGITDAIEVYQNDPSNLAPSIVANLFGVGVDAYKPKKKKK